MNSDPEKVTLLDWAHALSGGCHTCMMFIRPKVGREKYVTVLNMGRHMTAKHNYTYDDTPMPKRLPWWRRLWALLKANLPRYVG